MDSASMAFLYYQEGLGLFEPQMHNLLGGQGKAVGEFPLLYYLIGKLYSVFGYDIVIFRIFWGSLSLFGIFSIYKVANGLLNSSLLAFCIAIFTFTSPVYLIYGISFVPDSAALSISFISFYFFYLFYRNNKRSNFIVGLLLIVLAGLLKITVLIPVIAFVLTIAWYAFRESKIKSTLSTYKLEVVLSLIGLLGIFFWYLFAIRYNSENNTNYFFLKTNPIWELRWENIFVLFLKIKGWSREYYSQIAFLSIGIMLFISMARPAKSIELKKWTFFLKIYLLGCLAYLLLFYGQFQEHDYYILCLIPLAPISLIIGFRRIFENDFSLQTKNMYKHLLLVVVVLSSIHSVERCRERLVYPQTFWNTDIYHASKLFEEHSIGEDAIFFAPFDVSPNCALYAMNRRGYSAYNFYFNTPEEIIAKGAEYLLVPFDSDNENQLVKDYADSLIIHYNQVRIYSIKKAGN
jgi:hypothetical protein